jgi:hypothetical protein
MGSALSAIKTLDDYTFAFRTTTKDIFHAGKHGDIPTVVHGGLTNVESTATLAYYGISVLKYASSAGYLIEESARSIPGPFSSLFKLHGFIQAVGGIGLVANTFTFARESISLARQQIFHSIFKNNAWKGLGLAHGIKKVAEYKDPALKSVLPEWLYKDLQSKGGKTYLDNLATKIDANDRFAFEEGISMYEKMRVYSRRKQIMHILGWVSAILGIIGCIGVFVACPPAAISALLIASTVLMIAQYVIKKGWVENPNEGFSWKLCLPEFIQRKLEEKPKPNFYELSGLYGFRYAGA